MFPEGTRSPDGAMHEFKSGAGYLALRSGCDVLPIHLSGTIDVLGKGSLIPRRHPVEVRIGRVITSAELRDLAASSRRRRRVSQNRRPDARSRHRAIRLALKLDSQPPKRYRQAHRAPRRSSKRRAKTDRSPELPRGHAKA